jgi:hypothetical protein
MIKLPVVCCLALIATAVPMHLAAQRSDGCFDGAPLNIAEDVAERVFSKAGYSRTEASLVSALTDPDPSVRSLASDKLASGKDKRLIRVLMGAWSIEKDYCTRGHIERALQPILQLHWSQMPGSSASEALQPVCSTPASPLVALELRHITPEPYWTFQGATLEITIRNLTTETLPYLYGQPRDLYTYRVIGPNGQALQPVPGIDCPNRDCSERPGQTVESNTSIIHTIYDTKAGGFMALKPQDNGNYWFWKIGEEFDMSQPGMYSVSLGSNLTYLDTNVCSNVVFVTVK